MSVISCLSTNSVINQSTCLAHNMTQLHRQPDSITFQKTVHHPWVLMFFLVFLLLIPQNVSAQDTTDRLRTSVARMNSWLGVGEKAQTWRRILNLNVLDSQAAKGEQADVNTLRGLLGRFENNGESVGHPVFQEVKAAITNHVAQLYRVQTQELFDLQFAAQQAIAKFEPPTVEALELSRDYARYELQVLKKVYRRDLDSRTRAEIFYKLKLNDTIKLLSDLKVELPPEVSLGKMRSMRKDEEDRLEEIEDRIDALPIETPEEDENEIELEPLQLDSPGPDNSGEDDLKTLETKQKAIEERIKELREKMRDVLNVDRPRLIRRRDYGNALREAQSRFRMLARKQTDPAFASAKSAFDRFADAFEFSTEDNIQEEYIEQVVELAKLIPELGNPESTLDHARLGSILQWLEDRNQLKDLCVSIRRKYSGPNAYVSISSRLIQSLTSQSSSEVDNVAEDFLGRFARGTSMTNTTVNVVTVPDPDQIHVSILLNGTASTNTYVRELVFKIRSSASGLLSARRDLFANLNGLYASQSNVDAMLSAQFGGISSKLKLVQRLAARSFAEEKGRTDAESGRRARTRLRERFDSETGSAVSDGVMQIENVAAKAREYAAFLPQLFMRSFSDRVEVVAKKDTRATLAATVYPQFRAAGSDVQIKLHESMLANYLDQIFAGKEFTNSDFEKELMSFGLSAEMLSGASANAEADDAEEEEFRITFPEVRPVQIRFSQNRMSVIITGTRFEQGENSIKTSVAIKLSFKVVNRNGKLFLIPQGGPEVNLAEGEKPGADSIAFAKILETRLGEVVEKNGSEGFELPANLLPPVAALDGVDLIRSLHLGLFEMRDGWLYLGWNYQGGVVSTPAIWNELTIEEFQPLYLPEGESEAIDPPVSEESVIVLPPVLEVQPPLQPVIVNEMINDTGTVIGR